MDIVIPIKSELISLAIDKTIPSIVKYISFDNLYIITQKENFDKIQLKHINKKVILLDEDLIIPHLSLNAVREYLIKRINTDYSYKWYFQQFLKLAMALHPNISPNFLVWDADAILLKNIAFFTPENKILISKSEENHLPYFWTIKKLLNIEKQVSFSFISEHFVFTKKYVMEMLNYISASSNEIWWKTILNNIDEQYITKSGFSEYETYGNFIVNKYPDLFEFRTLKHCRDGTFLFGPHPNGLDLTFASLKYTYISFESRQARKEKCKLITYCKILIKWFINQK